MATQMKSTISEARNYLEPDDGDISSAAQQLVHGALKLEDYRPIRELERIKSTGDQALQSAHFSTNNEKKMAESLQHNTNGWIDTAKDTLSVAVNFAGLVTTCAPAVTNSLLTPDDMARAQQYVASMGESLKRIYNRSCDMAVNNSHELLLAINSNENTSVDSTVTTAAEEHRRDLQKFQQGEVNVDVPYQSHAKLLDSVKQAEPNEKSNVRQAAERSSRAWDVAVSIGVLVLTVGAIIGFVLLKKH